MEIEHRHDGSASRSRWLLLEDRREKGANHRATGAGSCDGRVPQTLFNDTQPPRQRFSLRTAHPKQRRRRCRRRCGRRSPQDREHLVAAQRPKGSAPGIHDARTNHRGGGCPGILGVRFHLAPPTSTTETTATAQRSHQGSRQTQGGIQTLFRERQVPSHATGTGATVSRGTPRRIPRRTTRQHCGWHGIDGSRQRRDGTAAAERWRPNHLRW
mmetsp:Transcript_14008/g.39268  ORF Transcript_14008/g.39268 Transcript_14008/m.39268 type:complete len:213 (-) Transcript_14008:931-1569(-)